MHFKKPCCTSNKDEPSQSTCFVPLFMVLTLHKRLGLRVEGLLTQYNHKRESMPCTTQKFFRTKDPTEVPKFDFLELGAPGAEEGLGFIGYQGLCVKQAVGPHRRENAESQAYSLPTVASLLH